jgi:hypothetical protein
VIRFVPIVLAIVGFLLTYTILTWNRSGEGTPEALVTAAAPPVRSPAPIAWGEVKTVAQSVPAPSPARHIITASAPDNVAAEEGSDPAETQHDPSQEIVPVTVVLVGNDGSARTMNVRNRTAQPLDLTVTTANAVTGNQSSIQVTVAPNANTDLSGTGLVVASGDLVTIENPHYRDRVIHAQ